MTSLKKITLTLLSSFLILNSVVMPLLAAEPTTSTSSWYNQGFGDWFSKVYDDKISPPSEIFGERYTAAQVQWIVYSLVALPLTLDPESKQLVACFISQMTAGAVNLDTCGQAILDRFNKFDEYFQSLQQSKVNDNSSVLAHMFDYKSRSISGIGYISNLVTNFALVKPVNAQGFGYNALNPVQQFLSGSRNIAYALIVLVVIVFAFMIMFRVKLSPQLVISVQSVLPKVVVALILATFSYAIAGLLIDLMYVIGSLLALLLVLAGFAGDNGQMFGVNGVYYDIFPSNTTGLYFLTHMLMYDLFFLISILIAFIGMIALSPAILAQAIFVIIGILLVIWIFILSIWYTFKATWVLVKTLISIYLSIIVGPIQIVLGAVIPSLGFGSWAKKLFAELLTFPVTAMFMFFAWKLMWASFGFTIRAVLSQNFVALLTEKIVLWSGGDPSTLLPVQGLWAPEIIGFSESVSGIILLLMSFTMITLIPKAVDIMKMLIMGEKFAFGTAIGEAMGPLKWAGGQAYNQTGAREAMELGQVIRKTRIMNKYIGEGTRGGRLLERFIGGDPDAARGGIKKSIENYEKRLGYENDK